MMTFKLKGYACLAQGQKKLLLFTAVFLTWYAFGQEAQEHKFGKVDAAEFAVIDTTGQAEAIVLSRYRDTHFDYDDKEGWIILTTIRERLLILHKKGLARATKKVLAYKDDDAEERLKEVRGYTYKLAGDEVEKIKLDEKGVFETEKSERFDEYAWTMPDVTVGSIVEWEYEFISPFWKIDDLVLQDDLPVKQYKAIVKIPEVFKFKMLRKGYFDLVPSVDTEHRNIMATYYKQDGFGHDIGSPRTARFSFSDIVYTFELKDIEPLQEEVHVNTMEDYRYTIYFEIESFTRFDKQVKTYASSWDEVTKAIYESEKFGKQLENTAFLSTNADDIYRAHSNLEDRAKAAYEYVRENFVWDGEYGKYVNDDLRKIYKSHTGNVAEINLTLVALLRAAKINANPVLLSTKGHGKPVYPTLEGFDYVIAAVEIGDELLLLDATDKMGAAGFLPEKAYNWEGRLVRRGGTSTAVDLYPKEVAQQNYMLRVALDSLGVMTGNYKKRYATLDAIAYKRGQGNTNKTDRANGIMNEYSLKELENLKIDTPEDPAAPIVESFDFEWAQGVDRVGDKFLISPMLFTRLNANVFKSKERTFPIDFNFPHKITKTINILLPPGYEVESLPDAVNITLPDGRAAYSYRLAYSDGTLSLNTIFSVGTSQIPAEYYLALKDIYDQRVAKESEKIVLVKKTL